MENRVDYTESTTLVRPNEHSFNEVPFDATTYYEWDYDNEYFEDLQELIYMEKSE
jgi:hypothetical protein